MKPFKCSLCGKHFKTEGPCRHHQQHFHAKRFKEAEVIDIRTLPGYDDGEMSEAEYQIEKLWGL